MRSRLVSGGASEPPPGRPGNSTLSRLVSVSVRPCRAQRPPEPRSSRAASSSGVGPTQRLATSPATVPALAGDDVAGDDLAGDDVAADDLSRRPPADLAGPRRLPAEGARAGRA